MDGKMLFFLKIVKFRPKWIRIVSAGVFALSLSFSALADEVCAHCGSGLPMNLAANLATNPVAPVSLQSLLVPVEPLVFPDMVAFQARSLQSPLEGSLFQPFTRQSVLPGAFQAPGWYSPYLPLERRQLSGIDPNSLFSQGTSLSLFR